MPATFHAETLLLCSRCGVPLLDNGRPCVICATDDQAGPIDRIGPYTVVESLGRGPIAQAYRCQDEATGDRPLAVKILDSEQAPTYAERCLREARSVARVRHPNVVAVRAIGRSRRAPFVVSDHAGRSVAALVSENRALAPHEALAFVRAAAAGLGAAHAEGILHRNLRPSNLFIGDDGVIRVADFGYGGTMLPNPDDLDPEIHGYWSPEQLRGDRVDQRGDIYSLGRTFAFMLTGATPGSRSEPSESDEARIDTLLSPEHRALLGLLERMSAFDPADRFASCEEVIAAVDETLGAGSERHSERNSDSAIAARGAATACAVLLAGVVTLTTWLGGASPAHASAEAPVADTGHATTPVAPPPRALHARYEYTLGGAEARADFSTIAPGRERGARTVGGRLQVPANRRYAVLHDRQLSGDLAVRLSFVLESGAELGLLLRTDDDRRVTAILRAPDGEDPAAVELASGERTPAGTVTLAQRETKLTAKRPHLVELRRHDGVTHVRLDGHEVLRASAPLSGTYRLGLTASGGVELRNLVVEAERVHG